MHTPAAELAIQHSACGFTVTRLSDGKSTAPVAIPSPYEFRVKDQPNSNLMRRLRWYLEQFLDYPFPPETQNAENVLDALKLWGTQAFNTLFDHPYVANWLSCDAGLQIRGDDPYILSWPWEALFDPQVGYVAHHNRIERRFDRIAHPPPHSQFPRDRVNVLLVVARPYETDVRYRSIARLLVELIENQNLPAHVDVLRPPTFDQLRAQLRAHPSFYHVLHFDGHGSYHADTDGGPAGCSRRQRQRAQGHLIFEDANGEPDWKSGAELCALLREHALPAVVLNACQSATLDSFAENAFASVATALLKSGVRSVVAMAYSLYVSGAQVFLPSFYSSLFDSGSLTEAVRSGRQQMFARKDRVCARGRYSLEDWLVPVLYQQDSLDFRFATKAEHVARRASCLPPEIRDRREEYGFVGRDSAILSMERALRRNAPAILVVGLGGVGKTTLIRGFLRWLDDTSGLDGALWFDFRDIYSAEHVIHRIGEAFYGQNFCLTSDKLRLLTDALCQKRVLVVWDNFEFAASNLTDSDRASLTDFIESIAGCQGRVVIASRSSEQWLGDISRLELGGLDGEERWEYCDIILRELGLKPDRSDPDISELVDQLHGHPWAMRAVLKKLKGMPAAKIAEALRAHTTDLAVSEEDAALRLFVQGLSADLRPLISLIGLHEGYISADLLEVMANQADSTWTRQHIDRILIHLGNAGLLRDIRQATYEIHPMLTSYLRSGTPAREPYQRAFVDACSAIAQTLALQELPEQRVPFLLHASNFHFALTLAARLSMDQPFALIAQALGIWKLNSRRFTESSRLFGQLAHHYASRGDANGEAASLHELGLIAQRQRDFATARKRYVESLAISMKAGILKGAAVTCHQLGRIAADERNFAEARNWYFKSLTVTEKQGDLGATADTYHQLGTVALEEQDSATARNWYLKSLAISEKQSNLGAAASTYHQLGRVADHEQNFVEARELYLKSLAICEERRDLQSAARSYNELGALAQRERDLASARQWYLKSLATSEQQGDRYVAALTCANLGLLAGLQFSFEESGRWLIRSITTLRQTSEPHETGTAIRNFLLFYRQACSEIQQTLQIVWHEADLGDFPNTDLKS